MGVQARVVVTDPEVLPSAASLVRGYSPLPTPPPIEIVPTPRFVPMSAPRATSTASP
ncbi:hypothetical protein ACETU7_11985 [Rhodococcus sp. 3Y1]